jgi:hypothetical protein
MTDHQERSELSQLLDGLRTDADKYFDKAMDAIFDNDLRLRQSDDLGTRRDMYWQRLTDEIRAEAKRLDRRLVSLMGQIARAVRSAPLTSEADQRDVMSGTKGMRAALLLRHFRWWDTEVLNDEDIVLGVARAGQSDDEPADPDVASRTFADWAVKIDAILDLVAASPALGYSGDGTPAETARYRPGTAFIMMWMDKSKSDLIDVSDAVKEVFAQFGIRAIRADDIEHEGLITDRILTEIKTTEFCFADLSGARPNVYYEVGYAHALPRRVMLYRKAGTGLHFDLAGYNCPEYGNLRDLKEKLTQRLRALTNKEPTP